MKTQGRYEGDLVDGIPNGEGTISFPNGSRYMGTFKDGIRFFKEQTGTMYDKNENIIEKWEDGNDVLNVFIDNVTKKGILFRDTPLSKWMQSGRKWLKSGNDKKQGKYEGEIRNEVPSGQGTITFPNGEKYIGEWKDGLAHGKGTYFRLNGNRYVGKFKGGKA